MLNQHVAWSWRRQNASHLDHSVTCRLLNRLQMALSSSSTFKHTSPIMALSSTIASRAEVCSSFTTCGWQRGREVHGRYKTCHQQSRWNSSKDCHKCADEWTRLPYQNSLVQHLAALHVRRLNVNAVGSALPAVNSKRVIRHREPERWAERYLCSIFTHTCMSLKHLMQSRDLFSVENRM